MMNLFIARLPRCSVLRALFAGLWIPGLWMLVACTESSPPGSSSPSARAEAFANFEPLPIADPCKSVALGSDHYMVIDEYGVLHTWGNPINGQLGYEIEKGVPAYTVKWPRPVTMPGKVKCVGAGMQYSVAVLEDGTVWHWGTNRNGEISADLPRFASTPTQIKEIKNATAVAVGGRHALALLKDGRVMSWGASGGGQIGRGIQQDRKFFAPDFVHGLSQVQFISAGTSVSLAISESGHFWGWGYVCVVPDHGDCQKGRFFQDVPVQLPLANVVDASAGSAWLMALTEEGRVFSWGSNISGQQANGTTEKEMNYRVLPIEFPAPIVDVAAGFRTGYAATALGQVFGWGKIHYGMTRSYAAQTSPRIVTLSHRVDELLTNGQSSIFQNATGCWSAFGSNYWAVLSDGTLGPKNNSVISEVEARTVKTQEGKPFCSSSKN